MNFKGAFWRFLWRLIFRKNLRGFWNFPILEMRILHKDLIFVPNKMKKGVTKSLSVHSRRAQKEKSLTKLNHFWAICFAFYEFKFFFLASAFAILAFKELSLKIRSISSTFSNRYESECICINSYWESKAESNPEK